MNLYTLSIETLFMKGLSYILLCTSEKWGSLKFYGGVGSDSFVHKTS